MKTQIPYIALQEKWPAVSSPGDFENGKRDINADRWAIAIVREVSTTVASQVQKPTLKATQKGQYKSAAKNAAERTIDQIFFRVKNTNGLVEIAKIVTGIRAGGLAQSDQMEP